MALPLVLGEVVAPGAVGLEVALAALLAYCVLLGLSKTYDYSFGAFLRRMAGLFRAKIPFTSIGVPGGGAVASAFDKADDAVRDAMAAGLAGLETTIGKWWYSMAWVARETYDGIVAFGEDVHGAISSLVHGYVPNLVHAATQPIGVRVGSVSARLQMVARGLERDLVHRALALEAEIDRDFGKAWRGIDHLRGSLAGALAHLGRIAQHDIAALRDYTHGILNRRLTLAEKMLGATAIGAIAIAAMTRVFPYWQCSNVRRFMRGVCRSPLGAFEWLFALAALVVTALKPRQIADLGTQAVGLLDGILRTMQGHPLYSAPVTDWKPSGRYAPRGS